MLLSNYARARMSFNQFTPAEDDATYQQYQASPYENVTAEQFAYVMQYVEAARGAPPAPKMLHVFSTDPAVLNPVATNNSARWIPCLPLARCPNEFPQRSAARVCADRFIPSCHRRNVKMWQREGISVVQLRKAKTLIRILISRSFSLKKPANLRSATSSSCRHQ